MPIDGKFGLAIGSLIDQLRAKQATLASALDDIQTQINKLYTHVDQMDTSDPADATLYLNGEAGWANPQTPWTQDQDADSFDLTELRSLSMLTPDTTVAPAQKWRQANGGGTYGYDWDIEDVAVGRLDLYTVVAGTRVLALRVMRDTPHIIMSLPTTAPADANLFNGSGGMWYDEGASQVKIKVKSSAGVVKNGTLVTVA